MARMPLFCSYDIWCHLWSIPEETHGNMESVGWIDILLWIDLFKCKWYYNATHFYFIFSWKWVRKLWTYKLQEMHPCWTVPCMQLFKSVSALWVKGWIESNVPPTYPNRGLGSNGYNIFTHLNAGSKLTRAMKIRGSLATFFLACVPRLQHRLRFSRLVTISTSLLIAELRRPEGPPSGAPYSYRKGKETHELIFSWLLSLAVLLVGAYARRRRRRSCPIWRPYSK